MPGPELGVFVPQFVDHAGRHGCAEERRDPGFLLNLNAEGVDVLVLEFGGFFRRPGDVVVFRGNGVDVVGDVAVASFERELVDDDVSFSAGGGVRDGGDEADGGEREGGFGCLDRGVGLGGGFHVFGGDDADLMGDWKFSTASQSSCDARFILPKRRGGVNAVPYLCR